jgi:nitrogen fixation protein NifU and related proteins
MSELADLYQQLILDHHRNPRNTGRIVDATHAGDANNPLCGDRLTLTLRVSEGRVLEARCDVKGCAICRASGSMLTEAVTGRAVAEIPPLVERFMASVAGTGAGDDAAVLGPLAALSHVRHFPSRARCATLSWETLRRLLGAA